MGMDEKSAAWGNECSPAGAAQPMDPAKYAQIKRQIERGEHDMRVNVPVPEIPFLGAKALGQFDRLTQSLNMNRDLQMTDEGYFAALVETMDAVKDTVQWVMAQIKIVEMTYANDPTRKKLHVDVLRHGFMTMVRQSNGQLRPGDIV